MLQSHPREGGDPSHVGSLSEITKWIPAFAGMTKTDVPSGVAIKMDPRLRGDDVQKFGVRVLAQRNATVSTTLIHNGCTVRRDFKALARLFRKKNGRPEKVARIPIVRHISPLPKSSGLSTIPSGELLPTENRRIFKIHSGKARIDFEGQRAPDCRALQNRGQRNPE